MEVFFFWFWILRIRRMTAASRGVNLWFVDFILLTSPKFSNGFLRLRMSQAFREWLTILDSKWVEHRGKHFLWNKVGPVPRTNAFLTSKLIEKHLVSMLFVLGSLLTPIIRFLIWTCAMSIIFHTRCKSSTPANSPLLSWRECRNDPHLELAFDLSKSLIALARDFELSRGLFE